jgi:DNA-binding NtrC family response regulator
MTVPTQAGQRRILLVDDEPSLLKMMSVYLQRQGHAVVTAATTGQAAALVEEDPSAFAVAVIDATMDGMTMEELARKLLQADSTVRVLATSGYPVDMSALEAAAPGRVAFLHKPFSPEMLAASIRRMLGGQKAQEI